MFDNPAKNHQGVSLNDQLLAGPKTQRSISTLKLHLRLNPIVVVCDVVRMFYSINYNEQPEGLIDGLTHNKDLFRFLWKDDDNVEPDVYRFKKVLMGSKTSPFQANSLILHHVEKMIKETDNPLTIECCELLQKFVYIDDILLGITGEDKAIQVKKEVRRIFKTINMELSKFVSNSIKVLTEIKQDNLSKEGGQYFVKPIFKRGCIPLLNNYNLALDRYRKLRYRSSKNPKLKTMYGDAMNTLIKNDEVERVEKTLLEASEPGRVIYCLPQLPVVNEQKASTKVRPVFDGFAKKSTSFELSVNVDLKDYLNLAVCPRIFIANLREDE